MELSHSIERLKDKGFMNAGPLCFTQSEAEELKRLTFKIFDELPHDHPHYLPIKSGAGGLRGLPQHDLRIAELLNKAVSNDSIKKILVSVLGPDYKIWQIDFRRSVPGDPGLRLHQDGPGQLNMVIMLSDNPTHDGATAFLPGTHQVSKRIRDLELEASPSLMNTMKKFMGAMTGRHGDIGFFFNRTWHGRFSNSSQNSNNAILIAFFPAGGLLSWSDPYVNWSEDFLKSMESTELGRLMHPSLNTQKADGENYLITAKSQTELPYSLKLETSESKSLKLKTIITFLKLTMGSGRPIKRLIRQLSGKTST